MIQELTLSNSYIKKKKTAIYRVSYTFLLSHIYSSISWKDIGYNVKYILHMPAGFLTLWGLLSKLIPLCDFLINALNILKPDLEQKTGYWGPRGQQVTNTLPAFVSLRAMKYLVNDSARPKEYA